jgi:rhodanese-related sulfurtransferase
MKPIRSLLLVLTLPTFLSACSTRTAESPEISGGAAGTIAADGQAEATFATITPQRLAELIPREDHLVIDVHIPYEGEIPGTDLHIPFNEIPAHLGELPADKDANLVLYCMSGRMSQIAARTLASLGYTNVMHVDGGMNAWRAAGFTLEGATPTQ